MTSGSFWSLIPSGACGLLRNPPEENPVEPKTPMPFNLCRISLEEKEFKAEVSFLQSIKSETELK